jgi:chaperone-like protein
MVSGLIVKVAQVVATGFAGAAAYDGVKRVARSGAVRGATVAVTAWGLRGVRAAETGAEKARLATADIVSEARARIGEETPAPGAASGHGHEH